MLATNHSIGSLSENKQRESQDQTVVDANKCPLRFPSLESTNVGIANHAVQTSSASCVFSGSTTVGNGPVTAIEPVKATGDQQARLELTIQSVPSVTGASSNIGTDSSAARSIAATASSNPEEFASCLTTPGAQEQIYPNHEGSPEPQQIVFDLNPDSKQFLYPFKNVLGLFVGFDHKVKPSSTQWRHWKDNVEGQLWLDVQGFQNEHKRKRNGHVQTPGVSIECRMSGYATADGKQVILSPRIWFLYDDKRWEKKLRKFVKELEWLPREGFGTPEIHRGCPRFTNLDLPKGTLRLSHLSSQQGYPIGGDVQLFIHVEETTSILGCGLLFCATFMKNGDMESQRVSRIGGLVGLDERVSAITTAHGFLENIFRRIGTEEEPRATYGDGDSPEQASDLASNEEACSDTDGTSSDEENDAYPDDKSGYCLGSENLTGALDSETLGAISWAQLPVSSIQETCFLGTSGRNVEDYIAIQVNRVFGEKNWEIPASDDPGLPPANSVAGGDFSFLDLPSLSKLRNSYTESRPEKHGLDEVPVYRFATPEELTEGPVALLLRPDSSAQGTLMPAGHEIFFSLHGAMIRVSKIAIDAPLGKSRHLVKILIPPHSGSGQLIIGPRVKQLGDVQGHGLSVMGSCAE